MSARRLAFAVVLATGLILPIGGTSAAAETPPATSAPVPPIYISPWGSAEVVFTDSTKAWIKEQNITVGGVPSFTAEKDGSLKTPIGTTAGDHLQGNGRIFYPGGMSFTYPDGTVIELKDTFIRVMPTPLWSTGVWKNGTKISDEIEAATTTPAEVLASGRLTLTGFKLDKVPFRTTTELSETFQRLSGKPGPKPGEIVAHLIPRFDYVPPAS